MNNLDHAFERFLKLKEEISGNLDRIISEEDAKIQIIQRILFEVLGWSQSDVSAESQNENGYSDYVIGETDKPYFLIEAKRIGKLPLNSTGDRLQTYKISGPVLRDANAPITQAASYSAPLGIQLAVVTDGLCWIIFMPFVPGQNYKSRQAFVFPSLVSLEHDFAIFFELISKRHIRDGSYRVNFDQIHEARLVQSQSLYSAVNQNDVQKEQKSSLAFDLEAIFTKFFSTLTGDDDPEMLINCFVETRESRVADFSLERITKNVLGNILFSENNLEEGLNTVIEGVVGAETGETVFIVGPSGAGKSTFLNRFFKKTISPEIRNQCLIININFLDATGNEENLSSWTTRQIISALEAELFAKGYPEWGDLQALYQREYIRRSEGLDKHLYLRDKNAFKEKFSQFVESQIETDREEYLRRLLKNVVANKKRLPVIVIDNTDEFAISIKEMTFQYFQSLKRHTNYCLLLFPVTDRSAWSLSKTEIFNIYSSKSFFLPTPSPREVFRKRVAYLNKKISSISVGKEKGKYLTDRGIRLNISDVGNFAKVVEDLFVEQDYAAKRVGELSNYNMREALNLSKRVITSSVFGVDDVVKSYIVGNPITISPIVFTNALLKGDYNFYKIGDNHRVFSIFQVDSYVRQSPLIHLRILSHLRDAHNNAGIDSERALPVSGIVSYFDLMGAPAMSVERSLKFLSEARLIEPYDLSDREHHSEQRYSITYSGFCHLEMAYSNTAFFEQMAFTTRITDSEIADLIRTRLNFKMLQSEKMEGIRTLFVNYLTKEDSKFISVPSTHQFGNQMHLANELFKNWSAERALDTNNKDEAKVIIKGAQGTVDFFDRAKGFGFVSIPELIDDALLGQHVLKAYGADGVRDGEVIICDVASSGKGPYVAKIHNIVSSRTRVGWSDVVRVFPERRYGFIAMDGDGTNAFFHFSLFPLDDRGSIKEGAKLLVEVSLNADGKQQVTRVIEAR